MRMQIEGSAPMEVDLPLPQRHEACGGAARRFDARRSGTACACDACDAIEDHLGTPQAPGSRRSTSMYSSIEDHLGTPQAPGVADDPKAIDGGSSLEAGRRTLRRRVILGLVLAAAATAVLCWEYVPALLAWLADAQAVRAFVADHAFASRLAMLGINIVQVLLAFLPGEPVELASGYAFGFWEGTALCLIASGLATSAIYWATRRWGWKLVGLFFDKSLFHRFSWLENAKRLEFIMLIVFLIPGTPKDFLTYFAGLTNMRFMPVVLIATLGRIPSIVTSTITASAAGSGNWPLAACALAASALLLAVGGVMYRRLCARTR